MPKSAKITFVDTTVSSMIKEAWDAASYLPTGRGRGFPSDTELSPTVEEWHHLLNIAFEASLRTDEARWSKFRILFQRDAVLPDFGMLSIPSEIRLKNPIRLHVSELVKIAQAAPMTDSFIWVRRLRGAESYVITGVARGAGRWKLPAQDPDTIPGHPASIPMIEACAPGELHIAKGTTAVAWINGARVLLAASTNAAMRQLVGERFQSFVEQLCANASRNTSLDQCDTKKMVGDLLDRAVRAVGRIVSTIIAQRHGGLVVIVPSAGQKSWSQHLRAKYEMCDKLNFGVVDSALHQLAHSWACINGGMPTDSLDIGQQKNEVLDRMVLHNAFCQYQDAAESVGALSGVDGAIVLTDELRLWGFGVEVIPSESTENTTQDQWWPARMDSGQIIVETQPQPIVQYGTRHRAAFRICRADPRVLCLVVSQDGATKLVATQSEEIVYFAELEYWLRSL